MGLRARVELRYKWNHKRKVQNVSGEGAQILISVIFLNEKTKNIGLYIYLCGWYILKGPVLAENFFPYFIYGGYIACLVIENHSKTLKKLKVGVLRVQVV